MKRKSRPSPPAKARRARTLDPNDDGTYADADARAHRLLTVLPSGDLAAEFEKFRPLVTKYFNSRPMKAIHAELAASLQRSGLAPLYGGAPPSKQFLNLVLLQNHCRGKKLVPVLEAEKEIVEDIFIALTENDPMRGEQQQAKLTAQRNARRAEERRQQAANPDTQIADYHLRWYRQASRGHQDDSVKSPHWHFNFSAEGMTMRALQEATGFCRKTLRPILKPHQPVCVPVGMFQQPPVLLTYIRAWLNRPGLRPRQIRERMLILKEVLCGKHLCDKKPVGTFYLRPAVLAVIGAWLTHRRLRPRKIQGRILKLKAVLWSAHICGHVAFDETVKALKPAIQEARRHDPDFRAWQAELAARLKKREKDFQAATRGFGLLEITPTRDSIR